MASADGSGVVLVSRISYLEFCEPPKAEKRPVPIYGRVKLPSGVVTVTSPVILYGTEPLCTFCCGAVPAWFCLSRPRRHFKKPS